MPQMTSKEVLVLVLALFPNDMKAATSATGMAAARLLGGLACTATEEDFEDALSSFMLVFEECARTERDTLKKVIEVAR